MSPPSSTLRNRQSETPPAGFTRADFLAMIGILALLALAFRPVFASTRANTRALACLDNMRQLVSAWRMYAEDNQDRLPPNVGSSGKGWVAGWLDWNAGNPDNTNTLFLVNSKLGRYITNPAVYKCPSDNYLCVEGGRRMPRVRSVSMNGFVDGSAAGSPWYYGWYSYNKFSQIQSPPPASLWVFLEEHPDSINDAWFIADVTNPYGWVDMPSSLHDGACSFAFADGSSQTKKWLDKSTLLPVSQVLLNIVPVSGTQDTQWVIQRSSAPRQ